MHTNSYNKWVAGIVNGNQEKSKSIFSLLSTVDNYMYIFLNQNNINRLQGSKQCSGRMVILETINIETIIKCLLPENTSLESPRSIIIIIEGCTLILSVCTDSYMRAANIISTPGYGDSIFQA